MPITEGLEVQLSDGVMVTTCKGVDSLCGMKK